MYDKKKYKEKFFETVADEPRHVLRVSLFKKLAAVEERYDKDIAEMNPQELNEVLKAIEYKSRSMLSSKRLYLLEYLAFYNNNNLASHTLRDFKAICQISEDLLFSEEQIQHIEAKINKGKNAWLYNAILFCWYEGMRTQDIVDIRRGDIEGNLIRFCNRRDLIISDKLKGYLQQVIKNKCQYTNHARRDGVALGKHEDSIFKVITHRTREDDKNNEKGQSIEQRVMYLIRRTIIQNLKKIDSTILPQKIYDSGLVYFVKTELRKEGIELEELLDIEKSDYRNLRLQTFIAQFGSPMQDVDFKIIIKNLLK